MPILDRLNEARQRRRVPSQFDSRVREFLRRMERKIKFLLSGTLGFLLHPRRAKMPLPVSHVSSILFLRYDALGDAVLTTPLFRAIKRLAPHIRIGVAASNRSRPIFDNDPDVDDVFLLSESPSFQLIRELRRARKTKWDVVINLVFRDKTRGAIYSKIVAPRGISATSVREKKDKYGNIYSAVFERPPFRPPTPMVRQILQLLKDTVAFPFDVASELPSLPEFSEIAQSFRHELESVLQQSETSEYIIINTDASQEYKEWGLTNSLALARKIVSAWPSYHVFLSSAPIRAESIRALLDAGQPRISYLETPSVLHLAVAIRHARGVVSPDTSVAHFAAAQGVPVVGLYLVPNEFLPYAIPHRVLYSTEEKPASSIRDESQANYRLLDGCNRESIMDPLIIFAAVYLGPIVAILGFLLWLRVPRAEKLPIFIRGLIVGAFSLMLSLIGGALYFDPRPFTHGVHPLIHHVADNGFPSDHTTLSMMTAFVVMTFNKKAGIALVFLAILVALGRIYSGMHDLLDVTGSTIFAAIAFGISELLMPFVQKRLQSRDSNKANV